MNPSMQSIQLLRSPRPSVGRASLELAAPSDPRLNDGSMLLLDPTATGRNWNGIPSTVPNLAAIRAGAMAGKPAALMNGTFDNPIALPYGKFERTSKGLFHGMIRRGAAPAASQTAVLAFPEIKALLTTLLATRPDDSYYSCLIGKITRIDPSPTFTHAQYMAGLRSSAPNDFITGRPATGGTLGFSPATNRAQSKTAPYTAGFFMIDAFYTKLAGTVGSSNAFVRWSTDPSISGVASGASWALASYEFTNATKAGKTYEQLNEASTRFYTETITAESGKFFGDVSTAPSSLD